MFQSFVETGEVHDAELVLKRKDGSKIDVSLNVSSIRDEEGNVLYGRLVWRNITRHKRAENALRRSENTIPHPFWRIKGCRLYEYSRRQNP